VLHNQTVHREKKGKQVVSETPKNFVQSNHTKKPNPSQRIQNEQLQHNHIEQKTMVERKQTSLREKAARATWCYVCVTHRFSSFSEGHSSDRRYYQEKRVRAYVPRRSFSFEIDANVPIRAVALPVSSDINDFSVEKNVESGAHASALVR
jgi:hypothetical protein